MMRSTRIGFALCVVSATACSSQTGSGASDSERPNEHTRADGGLVAPSPARVDASANANTPRSTSADVDAVLNGSCAKLTLASSLLPSNILFVLDRSGSMMCNPPPQTDSQACEAAPTRANQGSPSKWEIVADALASALPMLPASAATAVSYFSNDDVCGVNSRPSVPFALNTPAQQSALATSLKNVTPSGGTPLVGATILAYKHIYEAALSGLIRGNLVVVLLTDGAQSDNCGDPGLCADAASCTKLLIEQEVPKASGPGAGIRTFVIGAPGSEPSRVTLSQIAAAGHTAPAGCDPQTGTCHFDMTTVADFASALPKALANIAGQTITCELPVPSSRDGDDIDYEQLNVLYTPGDQTSPSLIVPQDETHDCKTAANGWQYSADKLKIRLCGSHCERVRVDVGARIDVVVGCAPVLL